MQKTIEIPSPPDQVRIATVSTVEAAANAIRELILNGDLAPGARLRENEFAERLGVARHSFRAATQILIAESDADLHRWQERITAANPNYGNWDELSERFIIGDVGTVTRRLEDYAALGIDCFMFWFMDYPATDGLRLVAEKVLPNF